LRDAFGWNRPFARGLLSPHVLLLLEQSGVVGTLGDLLISRVRYSTLDDNLFVHSAYPTVDGASVFFGPDSYRFTSFLVSELSSDPPPPGSRIVDVGCGTGVGGIVAGRLVEGSNVVLADINERALAYAEVNALLATFDRATFVESDVFARIPGKFDVVISNPPYMVDSLARAYRNGGAQNGAELSLRILEESLPRLTSGGRLLLYTGTAVISGSDVFLERAQRILAAAGVRYRYNEIDPDVFSEELEQPAYADVERIAAVSLVAYAN
jgi:methylase of polypeptide subunit release factors